MTELSDLSNQHAEKEEKIRAEKLGKKNPDGFAVWGNHASQLIGACQAIRDMNMHCIVTALATESTDDNG